MKKVKSEPFKVEMDAYQKGRAAERFKWAIREDRFTNPDSPYYHKVEKEETGSRI